MPFAFRNYFTMKVNDDLNVITFDKIITVWFAPGLLGDHVVDCELIFGAIFEGWGGTDFEF